MRDKELIEILKNDLERAINLSKCYAYALGIQEGGPLYDELQGLMTKYKMGDYAGPSGYSLHDLVTPDLSSNILEGTETPKELEA